MATHSIVLAWRIPGMGEPGGLLSMGSHRVGHNWSDLAAAFFPKLNSDISGKTTFILLLNFHLFHCYYTKAQWLRITALRFGKSDIICQFINSYKHLGLWLYSFKRESSHTLAPYSSTNRLNAHPLEYYSYTQISLSVFKISHQQETCCEWHLFYHVWLLEDM